MKNPVLINEHQVLGQFVQSQSTQSVGKLYEFDQLLREIAIPSETLINNLEQAYNDIAQAKSNIELINKDLETEPTSPLFLANRKNQITAIRIARSEIEEWLEDMSELRSAKIPNAIALNQSIPATQEFEISEKTVNDILLYHLSDPDAAFTDNQMSSLRSIAARCPQVAGPAVGKAMMFLPSCEHWPLFEQQEACAEERLQVEPKPELMIQCAATPNPASDVMRFTLTNGPGLNSACLLTLTDASRYAVRQEHFKSTVHTISVADLAPGLYFYRIDSPDYFPAMGKFVVVR